MASANQHLNVLGGSYGSAKARFMSDVPYREVLPDDNSPLDNKNRLSLRACWAIWLGISLSGWLFIALLIAFLA